MLQWERFESSAAVPMRRARVDAGWLVADVAGPHAGRVTLVRDAEHDWDGTLIELR